MLTVLPLKFITGAGWNLTFTLSRVRYIVYSCFSCLAGEYCFNQSSLLGICYFKEIHVYKWNISLNVHLQFVIHFNRKTDNYFSRLTIWIIILIQVQERQFRICVWRNFICSSFFVFSWRITKGKIIIYFKLCTLYVCVLKQRSIIFKQYK